MKKALKILIVIAVIAVVMAGVFIGFAVHLISGFFSAGNDNAQDNPLKGKDTNERIIMSLEKTYPEHEFILVKEYSKYNGKYYAVFADENGIEFKVDRFIYNNTYHFGCYDEYLWEVLKKQNFLEKATAIANNYGYETEFDEANIDYSVLITMEDDVNAETIATMMKEILTSVDIPEMYIGEEGFSTGEVNYYTHSYMRMIFYSFTYENGDVITLDGINFLDKNKPTEELSKDIQFRIDEANRILDNQD